MKRILYSLLILTSCLTLSRCSTPDEEVVPYVSQADRIGRFRVYRNINEFYDARISAEDTTIVLSIPSDMSLDNLRPEVIISAGAQVTPASGETQSFTRSPVTYKVTAADGIHFREYKVTVTNDLN